MSNGVSRAGRSGSAVALVGLSAATGAAVAIGRLSTGEPERNRWYRRLSKPSFQPPSWVFGPVWTTLYALSTLSAWRVWRTTRPGRRKALATWFLRLGLDALWAPLFFRMRRPGAALLDAALLVPTVASYKRQAGRIDRAAGWMMTPYVGWAIFAVALNAAIVNRNR